MGLPESIRAVIEQTVSLADLSERAAAEVRADLEQHFRDGLAAGRTPEQLIQRFGQPAAVAPFLARSPAPPGVRRTRRSGAGFLGPLAADLRFGARFLARSPALTLTAMVILALGVGANTVVFTVVNELLLRPLPVEHQSSLVDVWADLPGGNGFLGFAYQDFVTYRDANTVLVDLAAFTGRRLDLGEGGEVVVGQLVSPEYFGMLGLSPTVGRLAFPGEGRFGEEPTVVLSHAFWLSSLGGDPAVLGRTIRLDGHAATVVGVGPEGFSGHFIGFPSDLWLPLSAAGVLINGFDPADRTRMDFEMIGRLRAGVSPDAAQAALNAIARRIELQFPEIKEGHRVAVTPTTGVDHSLQAGITVFVTVLAAVSGLVLLIACLNVGCLLLVRTMSRDREMAIRLAIGAGNGRLIRQLITEGSLLVLLGAALGTWVAVKLNALLVELIGSLSGGLGLELTLDWRVLALTATAALVAAVLACAAPAVYLLNKDPAGALRTRTGGPGAGTRLRTALVVGQVAVSVVLVVAAGLFVRALAMGARAHPGFAADEVATFTLSLHEELGDTAERSTVQGEILDAIASIPGIDAVTVSDGPLPGVARSPMAVEVPGVLPTAGQDRMVVDVRVVGAGFLGVMGVPLHRGRDFNDADARDAAPVAVASEAFVRRFWPGEDPVGRAFRVGGQDVRVIGVAADARYLVQDDTPDPLVYLSLAGRFLAQAQITIRGSAPVQAASAVQEVVRAAVPAHPRVRLRTARQTLDNALFPQRVGSVLVGSMGLTALLLAAVGLYGLIQFTVTRDTHELGVRLALGGSRGDLLRVVFRKGFVLVAAGTVLGIGIALLAAPGLGSFLLGVSPSDPLTYGAVVFSFALVALLASWLPARRAARIHPVEALRGE
jgi:predicted permease